MKKFFSVLLMGAILTFNASPLFAQLGDVTPPPAPPVETTPPPVVTEVVTPPADTTGPVISGVASLSLGITDATLVWTTDELAVSHLEYGTTQSYGTSPTLDASALLAHTAVLTGLSANTTYYYCIHATDISGNTSNSCSHSFTTAAAPVLADTTPPNITLVTVVPITTTSATIGFTTSEVANAQIEYGTTAGYGTESAFDASLALTHSVTLSNLTPNTTYHYRIKTSDEIGNQTIGTDETFTTEAVSGNVVIAPTHDTTAPTVSEVGSISLGTTNATLGWTTNELAVSTLEYGTTQSYGTPASLSLSALLAHTATLTGLTAGIMYFYCIHSTDVAGNTANSCPHSFTTTSTSAPADTTAPVISLVTAIPAGTSSATIAWTTNELANAQVEYGITANYGTTSDLDSILNLTHSVDLPGLSPSTTYHYRVKSIDGAGNATFGSDGTFTTGALPQVQVQASSVVLSNIDTISIGTSQVTIVWNTDVPADSQIEYGDSENFGLLTTLNTTLTTSHSATIAGLTPNTNYIFRVKSKPMGASVATASNNNEFTTLSQEIPVVAPANILSVSTSTISGTGATILWTTDKGATSQVEYGISTSYGVSSAINQTIQTSHSITLSDLTPDITYHYRVKSIDEALNVTYSEDYTFTTLAVSSNGTPTSLNPDPPVAIATLAIGGEDTNSVALDWSLSIIHGDVSSEYDVRYSTSPITPSNFANATQAQASPIFYTDVSPNGTQRTYIVAGLISNTKYYFALKAKFENSNYSEISNVVSATTTGGASVNNESSVVSASSGGGSSSVVSTAYGAGSSATGATNEASYAPTLIKAEPADSQVIFTWKNPGEANFVRTVVVRKEGGYPTSPTDGQTIYEGRAETFADSNVSNGTIYYYAVYAYNHFKTYSNGIRVSLAPKAGNKEVKFNESGVLTVALPTLHFIRMFKKGDTDIEIEHLQEVLSADGDSYQEKYITGYFGDLTEIALKKFQAKHRLAQTGVVDQPTQKELNVVAQSETRLDIPQDYAVFTFDLQQGNRSDTVSALQKYLVYEGSLSADNVTGFFGSKTKIAVTTFQKKYGISPVSGYVGYKTRHKMKELAGL